MGKSNKKNIDGWNELVSWIEEAEKAVKKKKSKSSKKAI